MRVVALCDKVFFSEAHSKSLSFKEAAQIAQVPVQDVERVLVHVLSIGLLEGRLDESGERLVIKSVKPRDLDDNRLLQLRNKFVGWAKNLENTLDFVKNS